MCLKTVKPPQSDMAIGFKVVTTWHDPKSGKTFYRSLHEYKCWTFELGTVYRDSSQHTIRCKDQTSYEAGFHGWLDERSAHLTFKYIIAYGCQALESGIDKVLLNIAIVKCRFYSIIATDGNQVVARFLEILEKVKYKPSYGRSKL